MTMDNQYLLEALIDLYNASGRGNIKNIEKARVKAEAAIKKAQEQKPVKHEQVLKDSVEAWVSYKLHDMRHEGHEIQAKAITEYLWRIMRGYEEKLQAQEQKPVEAPLNKLEKELPKAEVTNDFHYSITVDTRLQQLREVINNWWDRSRNDISNACYYAVLQEIDKVLKPKEET